MSIPFTQYLLPHGRKRAEYIDRPTEIEALADAFIKRGGWFECEILTTGHVSLTACAIVDDEPQDIEMIVCPNGPEIPVRVDELVRKAAASLPPVCTEEQQE